MASIGTLRTFGAPVPLTLGVRLTMTSIRANSEVSYISVYMILAVLVIAIGPELALGSLSKELLATSAVLIALAGLFYWVKLIQRHRLCEITVLTNQVTIHSVSPLFSPRQKHYPLEQFGSVRSYISLGRFPRNRVELVTKAGGEALLVAWFVPSNGARSFWSVPAEAESPKAALIRKTIADQCGLIDPGFQGTKMVGAEIGG
jgi:hypothetical protein